MSTQTFPIQELLLKDPWVAGPADASGQLILYYTTPKPNGGIHAAALVSYDLCPLACCREPTMGQAEDGLLAT